jgi:hypothetical protein
MLKLSLRRSFSGGQIWTVHLAADHTARQALTRIPGIVDKAVFATQLTNCQLRNPGRVLAYGDRLLQHVVSEAESCLYCCWLEGRLFGKREVSAVHSAVAGMASQLRGFPFGHCTSGRVGGVCVGFTVGAGDDPARPLVVGVGAGLATTCR